MLRLDRCRANATTGKVKRFTGHPARHVRPFDRTRHAPCAVRDVRVRVCATHTREPGRTNGEVANIGTKMPTNARAMPTNGTRAGNEQKAKAFVFNDLRGWQAACNVRRCGQLAPVGE